MADLERDGMPDGPDARCCTCARWRDCGRGDVGFCEDEFDRDLYDGEMLGAPGMKMPPVAAHRSACWAVENLRDGDSGQDCTRWEEEG